MTVIYRPTPLEHAYASYILILFFKQRIDVSLKSIEDDDENGDINVEGRDAVPFLTKVSEQNSHNLIFTFLRTIGSYFSCTTNFN